MGRKDRIFQQWSGVILSVITLFSSSSFAKYSGGTGEPNTPYQIADVNDLMTLANDTDDYNKCFIMTADIDLDPNLPGNQVFINAVIARDVSISPGFQGTKFTGIFDGYGHTISNLFIDTGEESKKYIALFGNVDYGLAVIKNLGLINPDVNQSEIRGDTTGSLISNLNSGTVSNCYVSGGRVHGCETVGGLIACNGDGLIENCWADCNVYGKATVGGLLGCGGPVYNCHAHGNVSGVDDTGGLIGSSGETIANSYATGAVTGRNVGIPEHIGGLIGSAYYATIIDCYATGSVTGITFVGGLTGGNTGSYITRSYATGNVSGITSVGGLTGGHGDYEISYCFATGNVNGTTKVGGLVGGSSEQITNSFASGNVMGSNLVGGLMGSQGEYGTSSKNYSTGAVSGTSNVGGLVGRNYGQITNSFASGNVAGDNYVGGLMGSQEEEGTSYKNYSTGAVSGTSNFGGLVGYKETAAEDFSFWDVNTSGQTSSDGGTGKITAEMKTESTFTDAGWDFNDVWAICEGTNYPRLQWSIPAADMLCPDGVTFVDYAYLAERWFWNDYGDVNGIELTGDGKVDNSDFALFANWWGQSNCGNCGGADYSWDQDVDIEDLAMLCNYWLATEYGDVEGAELTGDGLVDLEDLAEFVQNWLQ